MVITTDISVLVKFIYQISQNLVSNSNNLVVIETSKMSLSYRESSDRDMLLSYPDIMFLL